MNIVVLNGSPKGELSVTMQSVAYLAKLYPQHQFNLIHIAQRLKRLEGEPAAFQQVIDQVRAADAVLWGFPLYILMVHANYKRFIELIFERGAQAAFAGKYAAALSTSIHFFDHTAHNYVHAVCDDLGMRFVDSFSPDMYDLMTEAGRQQLALFGRHFLEAVENQAPTQPHYAPLAIRDFVYQPELAPSAVSTLSKKVVILHDASAPDSNLARMVARCRSALAGEVTVVNIRDLDIKGSCLGCLECAGNYRCAYTGKDGYIDFYKSTVMTADVLIYAGRMVDRYLSARWKMFFDRIFFNTHTPVLAGKQVAFVISGPFGQAPNLMEILRGFFEFQGANIVGVVSDDSGASADLDRRLDQLMAHALACAQTGYARPQTFLGVGGMKIFRDDIYGRLRTVFAADHRAYGRMGLYKTFPQAELNTWLLNTFVAPIVNLPPIRGRFDRMIKRQMVAGHKQVVAKAQPPAAA
jgi:multimeric flavodoxin WrbA